MRRSRSCTLTLPTVSSKVISRRMAGCRPARMVVDRLREFRWDVVGLPNALPDERCGCGNVDELIWRNGRGRRNSLAIKESRVGAAQIFEEE